MVRLAAGALQLCQQHSLESALATRALLPSCSHACLALFLTCASPEFYLALVPAGDRCTSCSGSCLVSEKKTFEVGIEAGMKQNSKIVLRGEAGCTEPGLQPGDVVLVLQQKEHETFTRLPNPADLIFEKHISLKEALCGCAFNVKHLDGRMIRITSAPGEVIKPNSFKVVPEEGMPVHTRPFIKGNLYIKFEVGGEDGW
jgi:DnaJ family protein A protein 2